MIRDGQTVGTVEVSREGLYYRINCRCRSVDDQIHRLYADEENLGVLFPDSGMLTLETRVAVKRIRQGCCFCLDGNRGRFIPIRPGEPFAHIKELRNAVLSRREGMPGIVIK